ncbi:MAG: 2-aminoethylphosphonate aminotransferase [Gammaproteobacteria bacterium]
MKKEILLNPGPVNLSSRVRRALLRPDLCHREPEFAELQERIRTSLLGTYKLPRRDWAAVLLTGSGTAAVEAMLTSMVPDDGRVLIIENGVYGERMTRMAEIHNIRHVRLRQQWNEPVNLEALATAVDRNELSHVAVVHHETTTGRLNSLWNIARVCAGKNVPLLIDGVSSFGAEVIDFRQWHIAACAVTANKCLHGVPGASFVIVNRDSLYRDKTTPRTLYLDLKKYLEQQDAGGTLFTQSVQCFYALDEALQEFAAGGGREKRQRQYRKRMRIIRTGLTRLGVRPLLEESACSCVLHAYHLPAGRTYEQLHDALKKKGFVIYAGQGHLARTLFRVSAMGAITDADMKLFVTAVKKIINVVSHAPLS